MKSKFGILGLCLTVMCVLNIEKAAAWGTTGHRVVAEIADRHLTKKARKNIQKIIGNEKLAYWANWADFIKSDPDPVLNTTGSWHFVNTASNLNFEQFKVALQGTGDNNLYKAYLRIKNEAKTNRNLPLEKKKQDLYYIIHMFGDAHQPMHVSREEDQGGNKVEVTYFGRKTNLHRVWDSELVDAEKYSYTEYAAVLDVYNAAKYKTYKASFEEVLFESHELANKIYKDAENYKNLKRVLPSSRYG